MMKVIVNFGEQKVVVPCGNDGDLSIRDLISIATIKYSKLVRSSPIHSDHVQLRLNNGAVLDPDDRVGDVLDDREELFALVRSNSIQLSGDLSSSLTSSNLSTSLSDHERLILPSNHLHRHEVVVTNADLRTRSLRVKNDLPPHSKSYPCQMTEQIHLDDEKFFTIVLPKENSPLGIHVVPASTNEEQVNGLVLQNIEADGRVKRQGILQINDRIIEINRKNIERCSFDNAQMIFRSALLEPELELKIVRSLKKPPIPPRPASFRSQNLKARSTLSEIHPNQNDPTLVDVDANLHALNTRRLGKILHINLTKGPDGLGFKLASRDNPTGSANPIYVKTIFPKGAAIEDGRLQRGDRLLTVNGLEITQMSLQETVLLLRDTRIGETVELGISRQSETTTQHDFINEDMQIDDYSSNEVMTFDIPLNDTSSAGLGITLKGKTALIDGKSKDLGIFVKSILTGGAASRDNRLRPNDQILTINDSSLVNLSNLEAAAILHEAVRHEIHPGHIKMKICRSIGSDNHQQHVKEIGLPSFSMSNRDENELDLINYVPSSSSRKPPAVGGSSRSSSRRRRQSEEQQQRTDDVDENVANSSFDRETPFRQSVSEKRRLTNQPNKQILQWKQRSFHEGRTQQNERKQPMRALPDRSTPSTNLSPTLIRAASFESIHLHNEEHPVNNNVNDDERAHQAKLRARGCNDSFRQAVDKSYTQENLQEEKVKQKFRFADLFSTKSKRKDTPQEKSMKSTLHIQVSPASDSHPTLAPPTGWNVPSTGASRPGSAAPLSSHQGYQPHCFESNSYLPQDYHSKTVSNKSSSSSWKSSRPPIPRQFFQMNLNGSQSLRYHPPPSRPSYNPQPELSSTQRQTTQKSTRSYFPVENPANV